ncbi:MAG: cytochrome-c oxidase, cbb3-type subunit III [Hyphomicrobiaceae bacterium]
MSRRETDTVTGIETTGHVWDDDIKELNRPMPRWWLWTFYASIVWAIGYMIAFPAIPTLSGYTRGLLGHSQRATLANEVEQARKRQAVRLQQVAVTPIADVRNDAELFRYATTGGKAVFAENCAPCHGRGGQGARGYPNLIDDDWLWGGTLADIQKTIQVGIRSDHKDARASAMPRFGLDRLLDNAQINDVAEYVLAIAGHPGADVAARERGQTIFAEQCVACHGDDGKGKQEFGAPNLTDALWLYGGAKGDIMDSIRTGRGGQMPQWSARLDPTSIKMLALYVHSLGGGK